MEILTFADESRRALDGDHARPVRAHVWRGEPGAPLVLVSHGTGGAAQDLRWLTVPLAEAGLSVAAVDHHGNNYIDGYLPESFVWWWDRARDMAFLIDALEHDGPVGTAGFSIGGYAAAALVGARLDPQIFRGLVSGAIPAPPTPEYPDLDAHLLAKYTLEDAVGWADTAALSHADERVTAAFLVCPSMGPLVTDESLAAVTAATAVRWGGADTVTPPRENGMRYAAGIPGSDGQSAGEDVRHGVFYGSKATDAPVRQRVAAEAVEFFRKRLE